MRQTINHDRFRQRTTLLTAIMLAGCGGSGGGTPATGTVAVVSAPPVTAAPATETEAEPEATAMVEMQVPERAEPGDTVESQAAGPITSDSMSMTMSMTTPLGPSVLAPTLGGLAEIASGLDLSKLLGSKSVPPSGAPDVVGAFRFLCGPGQVLPDDPIVYPGQPGKAHLHQFFGNLGANGNSTYASLRTTGESTCMNELNRSAYWMPAMLDGKGSAVRPDHVAIYYKRRPKSDPFCTTVAKACADIPRGFRLIFGWDQLRPREAQPENAARFSFYCVAASRPTTKAFSNMADPLQTCVAGQQLVATISTPLCWNGTQLDTPDHRSHMADMTSARKCPATHPYLLPQFTMSVQWTIATGDQPTKWTLASDHMKPGSRAGETFHSDYFEAWEEITRKRWHAACIDKMLNCSDGDLGDGQIMTRGKHYPSRGANPRLVAIPKA